MSLLKSIKKIGGKLLQAAPSAVAGYATAGPAGGFAGLVAGVKSQAKSSLVPGQPTLPGIGSMSGLGMSMGSLPMIGGVVVRGARAATATAVYYCRKYPGWCSSIGGTAAVEALVRSGSLPAMKRRRRRGITPKDLASFRRVANLIKCYSTAAHRVPRRTRCAPKRCA